MNRKRVYWGLAGLLILLLAMLFYIRVYQPKSTYETVTPTQGDFAVWIQGIGELTAQRFYPLGFTSSGRVAATYFDQGQTVAAGTLLAELDKVELQATLAEMLALREKTRVEIRTTQQDIALNQERLNLAKLAHDRNQTLLARKMISQAQFDQSESTQQQADISVKSARTRLALIEAELKRMEKSLQVLQVKLDQLDLSAPESLLIVERLAETGQSVQNGQAIFKVLQPESLWVRAYVDERLSGKLALGQKAQIRLRSQGERVFSGEVKRIDAQSDPVTLERVVYLGFSADLPPPFLYEQAQVRIHTEQLSQVWRLPNRVLTVFNQQQGVWLKRQGRAHFVPLKVQASDDQHFAFQEETHIEWGSETPVLVPNKDLKPLSEGARVFP
ncbi:MAG: efflux RND transporter periplasmic adaptor subunit [Thiotrichales bacterium]|nr:efflux RND transporter periplasmic adaptor subunit [Thiotrichales bacterium]